MKAIIKLSKRATIEKQGKYGWESESIYEPIFINVDRIETFYFAGLTLIKLASGDRVEVRETPEEIIALLEGEVAA
ncbi:flagellar FlbD family protein [Klebsiella aerogenes]|uniref:flagellar FlbD family protein n=1 Tax=Klebsiella aerogenes TaxID=548 RepID=UPI001C7E993E|nr:flagellar FlbD family protein [Klebsiella aerogenes]